MAKALKALRGTDFFNSKKSRGQLVQAVCSHTRAPAELGARQGVIPTPKLPEYTLYKCAPSGNGNYVLR